MFERIEGKSIEVREFGLEETKVILQRHEDYDRDYDSETSGKLKPEAVEHGRAESIRRIQSIIDQVPVDERDRLFFLVLSSDTTFGAKKGARSIETAQIIIDCIRELLPKNGINENNLLNVSNKYRNTNEGEPRPVADLREPSMFEKSPEFVAFMKEKYPGKDFWVNFEADTEKEKRLEMGVEGPRDMADRIQNFLGLIKRYSHFFHTVRPNSRLVVWSASHYDTISPWTKEHVMGVDTTQSYLGVDHGSGIVIGIEKDGQATVTVGEENFAATI